MAKEFGPITEPCWPSNVRLPVALTFEHQSGEGAPRLPGDRPNFMVAGAMEYGARTGIWNILELLDNLNVKATFMICGVTAQKYPDSIKAAHAAGHEIAGMSFGFDRVRTMSFERERSIVSQTAKALSDVCGARIEGWRCPDYRVSDQTFDVLREQGLTWDSSLLNDDYPCLFQCATGPLIEIPFTTSTADKTFIGYPYPQRGGPQALFDVWNSEYEVLYGEAAQSSRYMMLSLQTWAIGRPAPLQALGQFIQRVKRDNDTQFTRCAEIAGWCSNRVAKRN
jgi:peptidoglycan/xylan/chitin deacetylase (PgdA/CDA1 family)